MKKRIISMLLCICMVCTLLPVTTWAAADDHADKIKVAGAELTATGYYDLSNLETKLEYAPASPGSNGYVHWESTTGTLTLYGAKIDGGDSSGIYADQNFTIVLSENTVNTVTSELTNALTCDRGSITIKGPGKLNATGATNGIRADYTVSITDGATVNVIGENDMGIFISLSYSYWDGLRIESDAASVTITGKTYGVGYANTHTFAPPEIKCPNVTVTGETAAFQIAPTLNGVDAKASDSINGNDPETYNGTNLNSYKWFKSEALTSVPVTGVTVTPATLALTAGESDTLTANVAPDNATNKTVNWTSSTPAVATVDTNGKITAVAAGSATITATTSDGSFSDTCVVTVTVISDNNYSLWIGGVQVNSDNAVDILGNGKASYDADSKTLTLNSATIECETKEPIYAEDNLTIKLVGTNTITTTSQGNAILVVGGKLTIEGTGILNATSNNYCIRAHGGDIAISGVTVTAEGTDNQGRGIVAFENAGVGGNITISSASVTADGKTYGICASNDIIISSSTVTATSISKKDGVSAHGIDGGNITFTNSTVTVTAECTNWGSYGISCSPFNGCKITITDSTVTAKTVTAKDDVTSRALSAAPDFGVSPNWYQWTITENGKMTKSPLTPYSYDKTHTYLKLEPIIAPATTPVTDVTVTPPSLSLTVGKSDTLTAAVAPDNATNKTVTWTSSNPAVATVDANGKVTAIAEGTATITATTEDGGKTATCTVTVNAVSHSYTAEIKKEEALKSEGNCRDYAVYYYSCADCGKVENNDSHTFNGDKDPDTHVGGSHVEGASEPDHKTQTVGSTGATICDGCSATLIPAQAIEPDAHIPANVWSNDETNHWHTCTVADCGAVIESGKEAHSPDHQGGATEEYAVKCTVCGYIIEAKLNHVHFFDKEVADEQYKASDATCLKPATFYKSCACGEKGSEIFENGQVIDHTEGTEWKSDKDNHWHECVCGDKSNTATHKDENTDGKCDVCAYNVGVPTPPADSNSPQTGDNIMLWIALLFVSGSGIATTILLCKKRSFVK